MMSVSGYAIISDIIVFGCEQGLHETTDHPPEYLFCDTLFIIITVLRRIRLLWNNEIR